MIVYDFQVPYLGLINPFYHLLEKLECQLRKNKNEIQLYLSNFDAK